MKIACNAIISTLFIVALAAVSRLEAADKAPFQVSVEVEERVCQYEPTNNGAGMFWHAGSTEIARVGDKVFAGSIEVIPNSAPLLNVRWMLYERRDDGWHVCWREEKERDREPGCLCVSHDGRLLMSVNPTLVPFVAAPTDGTKIEPVRGPSRPEFLEFDPAHPERGPKHLLPQWEGDPKFSDHSYRAFAADGASGEFILFQTLKPLPFNGWALLKKDGTWKTGQLGLVKVTNPKHIPFMGEWDSVPYANVILKDRQVHYIAQSIYNFWDRIDPTKKELYGREKWGWPMRKLHYAYTPDITTKPFADWVLVDDTMDDGGTIGVGDSWLAPDGRVHMVYQKEPIHPRLRDTYFPDIKRDWRMCYAVLNEGKVLEKRVLLAGGETTGPIHPRGYIGHPRFHVMPDQTLYIIYNMEGTTPETKSQSGTYAARLEKDGTLSAAVRIPLEQPITRGFCTATPRCGNQPSEVADLLISEITDGKPGARYARIRFCPL